MFSTAVLMAAIVIVAKALGLLRDILVANAYGMQSAAQAYEIASRLPIMIFDFVIGGVVSAAFIPIFSELLVKRSEKDAMRFANSYVNLIFVLTATMALLGILFSDSLVRFLAPEASSEVLSLASYLSKIMFPMIVFTGLAFSFVGILQSLGEFRIPALISLVSNSIMVAYLFFLNSFFGIVGLAVAMLLGWASQALVQVPKLRSLGYRYSPVFDFASPEIKRSLKSALPILIGTWTQPICSLINTRYASGLDNGRAITALSYSNKLYIIIVGVFTFVATNLLFPYMSRANASGKAEDARRLMISSVKILVFIIAPITVGIIILAHPFCAVIYERGAFTPEDTVLTAEALRCYTVGMLFMSVNEVLTKTFFADGKTLVPMISSIISMTLNVILVVSLSSVIGVGGIALISGIATVVNCTVNYLVMKKSRAMLSGRDWFDILKSVVCAAIMGGAVILIYRASSSLSNVISVVICAAVGIIVYVLLAFLLRSDELKLFAEKILKKQSM